MAIYSYQALYEVLRFGRDALVLFQRCAEAGLEDGRLDVFLQLEVEGVGAAGQQVVEDAACAPEVDAVIVYAHHAAQHLRCLVLGRASIGHHAEWVSSVLIHEPLGDVEVNEGELKPSIFLLHASPFYLDLRAVIRCFLLFLQDFVSFEVVLIGLIGLMLHFGLSLSTTAWLLGIGVEISA